MKRKFKKFDYVLAKGNEGRALEIAEAMEKSGFKIWGKRQGYKFGKWDAIAIDHCGDIIRCRTTDPACQNLVEFAQEGQVTLAPGDYVSTAGMTEDQYHAVGRAFMAAGAGDDRSMPMRMEDGDFIMWSERTGNVDAGPGLRPVPNGRHLTPAQVLNATNAGNKEEDMTPCEKLGYKVGDVFEYTGDGAFPKAGKIRLSEDDGTRYPAFHGIDCEANDGDDWSYADVEAVRRIEPEIDTLTQTLRDADEHDTKAKHHAAEHDRLMQRARDMLPDGWRLVRDGEPEADMGDPANWKQGDQLECVEGGLPWISEGRIYTLDGKNCEGWPIVRDNDGDRTAIPPSRFRFHSRPTT